MLTSTLKINMADAARIIKRLSNHWRHKLDIEFNNEQTIIHFSKDVRAILIASTTQLTSYLHTNTIEQLDQYENVVLDHLKRMANQEFEEKWLRNKE